MPFIDRLRFRATRDLQNDPNWRGIERFSSNILGPWRTYVPSWTAVTTNPTIGNGTIFGRWREFGDLVWIWVSIVSGSTTTFGSGFYSVSIPFRSSPLAEQAIPAQLRSPTDTRRYALSGNVQPSSLQIVRFNWAGGALTGTAPVTLAAGDIINVQGFYVPA
jgi:hypothetical protein